MPIILDTSEFSVIVNHLTKAGKNLKDELPNFLEAAGIEFLDAVQDAIIDKGSVDTGDLVSSFQQGSKNNIWKITEGSYSLTLELGSSLEYASYVNDGHWTNKKGQLGRWVPGNWNGDRFVYDPDADTGMYLKQQWVEGKHYFDDAEKVMKKLIPKYYEKRLEILLNKYINDLI